MVVPCHQRQFFVLGFSQVFSGSFKQESTYEIAKHSSVTRRRSRHGLRLFNMQVRKLGVPEAQKAVQNVTYNISGHNARINQNSTDNSVNSVAINTRAIAFVDDLRSAVKALQLPDLQESDALDILDIVQVQVESGKAKKSVVSTLLASLPHIANVTSIAASLLKLLK